MYAGLAAAIISLAVETPIVWLLTGDLPWGAARMTVAMLLGPDVLSPPTFDFWIVTLAFLIHLALSAFYALILAWIIHGETPFHATITGAAFGIVVFSINMYALTDIFFPWFIALRSGITFFSHIVLGATIGWSYIALTTKKRVSASE